MDDSDNETSVSDSAELNTTSDSHRENSKQAKSAVAIPSSKELAVDTDRVENKLQRLESHLTRRLETAAEVVERNTVCGIMHKRALVWFVVAALWIIPLFYCLYWGYTTKKIVSDDVYKNIIEGTTVDAIMAVREEEAHSSKFSLYAIVVAFVFGLLVLMAFMCNYVENVRDATELKEATKIGANKNMELSARRQEDKLKMKEKELELSAEKDKNKDLHQKYVGQSIDLTRTEATLKSEEARRQRTESEAKEWKDSYDQADAKNVELMEKLQSEQQSKNEFERQCNAYQLKLDNVKSKKEDAESKLAELNETIAEMQRALKGKELELKQQSEEKLETETKLTELQIDLEEERTLNEKLEEQVVTEKERSALAIEEKDAQQNEFERQRDNLDLNQQKLEDKKDEIKRMKQLLEQAEANKQSLKEDLDQERKEKQKIKEKSRELESKLEKAQKKRWPF